MPRLPCSHNIVDLSKVHERAKKEYVELLGLLEKEEKKQTGISDDAKEKMELVEASAATATDQVNQAMDRLLEAAEKWRTQLLEEVRQTKDRQTAELEKIQEDTSSHVSQIQEATGYLRRAERLSRQAEFISVVHAQGPSIRKLATSGPFTGATKSFSDDYPGLSDFPRWTDPIQFEAGDDEVTMKALRCLGSVRDRWSLTVSTIQTNCGPWLPKEMLTQFAEEAQLVMAGNELKRVLVKVCLVLKVLLGQILVIKPSRPDQALVSQDVSSVVIHPSSDKTVTYTPVSAFGKMDKVTLIFDTTETAQKFLIAVVGVQQSLRSGVLGVKSPAMVQPPGASKFGNLVWSSPPKPGLASSQPSSSPGKPAGVASTATTTTTAATAPGFFGTKTSMASQPALTTTPTPADGQKSVLGGFNFGKPAATSQAEAPASSLITTQTIGDTPATSTQTSTFTLATTTPAKTLGFGAATGGMPSLGSLAASSAVAPAFQNVSPQEGVLSAGHTLFQKQETAGPAGPALSLAQQFQPQAGSWECQGCYIQNPGTVLQCPACQSLKPGVTPDQVKSQPKAEDKKPSFQFGAAPTIQSSGFTFGSASVPSQPSQSTPLYELLKRDESNWECSGCLLSNKADVLRCRACQALKPGVKPEDVKDTGSGVKVGSAAALAGGFQFGSAQKSSEAPAQTGGFQFGSGGGFQFGAKTESPAPGASQASPAVQEAETRPVPMNSGNRTLLELLQADDIGMKPDATSTPVASASTPGTAAAATQPKPEESKGFGFSVPGGSGGSMGFQFKTALSSSFRDECSWECSGCQLSNKADVLRCPVCQTLKPGVTVKQV